MGRKGGYRKKDKKKVLIFKSLLLFLAMILCFFLVYKVHVSYPYEFIEPETATYVEYEKYPFPLHNDEWAHLAIAISMIEEKKTDFNPYLAVKEQDRELGFHYVLAAWFMSPGINPVLFYQYLAPIFLAINALFLFFLVYTLTKNYWMGLFSMLFFASIKSNLNILGNWFFLPLTFSLFLIFLYLYFFVKAIGKKKVGIVSLGAAILFFLIGILIYPFAAVLMALLSIIYIITRVDFIKKNWKYLVAFGVAALIIVVFVVKLYFWTGTFGDTLARFLKELVFKQGWTVLEYTYSLLRFYGIIPLILAVLGVVYISLKKEKKKNLLFIIWPAALLVNLILFAFFKFSLLFPYQRNFFYLLIGLAPLSAMGLYWLSELLVNVSKKYIFKKKIYSYIPAILLVIIVLFITFNTYYKIEPQKFSLHRVITQPEYEALLWLRGTYEPYNKVLAKPFFSTTVYPVSRNRVLGVMPSTLEGGPYARIYDFFNGGCDFKQKIVTEEGADFVISTGEIRCDFLGKVYSREGVNIYRVV